VEQLSEQLHAPQAAGTLAQPQRLQGWLQAFEAGLKPAIDLRLDENHARGLDMDRLDAGAAVAMERALRAVAADPARLRRYCLNSAGY